MLCYLDYFLLPRVREEPWSLCGPKKLPIFILLDSGTACLLLKINCRRHKSSNSPLKNSFQCFNSDF